MNNVLANSGWAERRALAFNCSLVCHVALLSLGALASATVARQGGAPVAGFPENPLLIVVVALIMAHCSVIAVWWGRTRLSPHTKTWLAALFSGGLWLLLMGVLGTASFNNSGSAEWAASLTLQMLVVAVAVTLCELTIDYDGTAARNRFSILFLLIWTTVIAVVLAAGQQLAARSGWSFAEVPSSEFFAQIQTAGLLNAALALAIYLSLRLPKSWRVRSLACFAAVVAAGILAPALMIAIFQEKVGAFVADMVWLFGAQGLFLVSTLVPAELGLRTTSRSETSGKLRATDAAIEADSRREHAPGP